MRRKTLLIAGGLVVLVVAAAAVYFLVLPGGRGSAEDAVLAEVQQADEGSAEVLASQEWGDGELVLVGYNRAGVRRLGVGLATQSFLGWRAVSYTEETVEPDDVVLGSLLIARSEGGNGHPPWTAAVGELLDDRVDRVEVLWADDQTSIGPRVQDAYMVVQEGRTDAIEARYLADDGVEIARVPVTPSP